jgi:predicted glycosyltransferase involved in capsule biosynthesis
LENLNLILEFIKNNFKTNIIVLEADKQEHVCSQLIDIKIYVEDLDIVFHRTKYLNQMVRISTTPYLAIWDTDVILASDQIIEAVQILRDNKAQMVFPYDGNFYQVNHLIKNLYLQKRDISILVDNIWRLDLMHGSYFVGGAFIVNKTDYKNAGMENENFYGWGPEDTERVKRWEILEFIIKRTKGVLFHLAHPRRDNSWFADKKTEISLRKELLRICKMDQVALKTEVQNWQSKQLILLNSNNGNCDACSGKNS